MADRWWCPKCGDEFRWEVVTCPDCDVDLVNRRPGPAPTPNLALVRVFVATDAGLSEIAKSLLEGERIAYLVRSDRLQYLFGWGRFGTGYSYIVGPTEFWVGADQAEGALACLQGLGEPGPADTPLAEDEAWRNFADPPAGS